MCRHKRTVNRSCVCGFQGFTAHMHSAELFSVVRVRYVGVKTKRTRTMKAMNRETSELPKKNICADVPPEPLTRSSSAL